MTFTTEQAGQALSELAYTFEKKGFDVLWIRKEGMECYFQVELNNRDMYWTIDDFLGVYDSDKEQRQ